MTTGEYHAEPPGRSIASAATLIALGNVTSRALGLVRELTIAALFGATGPTSAFRTATRVSTAVYDLLLSGATNSALVPVLTDYASVNRAQDLGRIVSTFLNLALIGLSVLVALLVLGAPLLVTVLGAEPEYWELSVDLTRLALPSVVLLGLSGVLSAVLYARRSFAVPAFTAAAYNLGIVLAALLLAGQLSIYSLALGLGLGALLQVLMQLPALRGLRYQPIIDLSHPGVRLVLRLYAPVFLGMLVSYVIVIVDTNLAWRTGPDSVAAMAFATTLIQFPLGLLGAAISLALLPSLSRLASQEEGAGQQAFAELLLRGMKVVLLLIVPIGVALVMLREAAVAVVFQRLAFDEVATGRTALALLAYSPQLPFVVVDQLLIVAFYARKQTVTPVLVGVAGAGVYLAAALGLIGPLGMPGLALANALQNSAHAVVLYLLLARQLPQLRAGSVAGFAMRVALAGAISALAVGVTAAWLAPWLEDGSLLRRAPALLAAGCAGLAAYALCLPVLRVHEAREVLAVLRRRGP